MSHADPHERVPDLRHGPNPCAVERYAAEVPAFPAG